MPKRKKSSKNRQRPLDRLSKKKPQTRSNNAGNRKPVGPAAISEAGVSPLNSEDLFPVLLARPMNPERPKRGRRTTADNFLVGGRNNWHSFLERYWHEIGWSLLEIRRRRTSTMEEVRKIFEPLHGTPNSNCADSFLRGFPQPIEGKELRKNRKEACKLHDRIHKMESQQQEMKSSCAYAENAVKVAGEQEREAIEAEAKERKERLQKLSENLQRMQAESNELDKKVRDQETYFYCSQLLAYLCKGKYAVEPFALANALAGAPQMGWRQSLARCAKMPRSSSEPQYPYGIFLAISRIWKGRSKYANLSPTELFKAQIPKLRKGNGGSYIYLSEGWRDLCLAIVDCSQAGHSDEIMPYALTQEFLKYQSRAKTQADQIMDERERLTISSKTKIKF
ncbi:MAG TPA: hypothetical protein VJN21_01480 [Candidatus Acidoferrales bacterium]|nr:hypothetical protein [Candidatus Acidoferrales bacterium]